MLRSETRRSASGDRLSLGGYAIGLSGASPADALRKVGLFLLFVGAGSGFESPRHDT